MRKLIAIFSILILTSCEIQYSMLDSSIDADTFSVEIFEEQAANAPAGYGTRFAEYLRDFIVSRTKLKLVKENADIEISGKIKTYNTAPVAVQSDEVAAYNRLTVSMDVSVLNNKTEKDSFKKIFSQFSDYESSNDLSSVEESLLEDINGKIAQDIVNQLSSNW
ncbi:MAG: LPS assembly lipoprotein LptE [Crocinitomicaceae bacterium]|nr:hypothetical protein [Crocinitomicaceae bacterium]